MQGFVVASSYSKLTCSNTTLPEARAVAWLGGAGDFRRGVEHFKDALGADERHLRQLAMLAMLPTCMENWCSSPKNTITPLPMARP